jgi:hypothetical protein
MIIKSLTSFWFQSMRGISCQLLQPGGSVVPRYVLQLLFSEKITKLLIPLQQLNLEKKNKHRFGILRILGIF